jgi:hypothetical protein
MREWHGLSSGEIASRLGMSPAATYALVTRARRSLARALTTATRQPLLGLNVGSLFLKLKAVVTGGAAKVVATGVVVGSVAVGGVAIERSVESGQPTGPPAPAIDTAVDSQAKQVAVLSSAPDGRRSVLPSVITRAQGPSPRGSAGPGSDATPAAGVAGAETPPSLEEASPAPTAPETDASRPAVPEPPPLLSEDPTELLPAVDLDLPLVPPDLLPPLLEGDQPLEDLLADPLASPPLPELELPLP